MWESGCYAVSVCGGEWVLCCEWVWGRLGDVLTDVSVWGGRLGETGCCLDSCE